MAMYHPKHPDKIYETANLVEVFDEPRAISWKTGTEDAETGELSFGGWLWRYDLEPTSPPETTATLTYDWSAVEPDVREYMEFPMFPLEHLDNSLAPRRARDQPAALVAQPTQEGSRAWPHWY